MADRREAPPTYCCTSSITYLFCSLACIVQIKHIMWRPLMLPLYFPNLGINLHFIKSTMFFILLDNTIWTIYYIMKFSFCFSQFKGRLVRHSNTCVSHCIILIYRASQKNLCIAYPVYFVFLTGSVEIPEKWLMFPLSLNSLRLDNISLAFSQILVNMVCLIVENLISVL